MDLLDEYDELLLPDYEDATLLGNPIKVKEEGIDVYLYDEKGVLDNYEDEDIFIQIKLGSRVIKLEGPITKEGRRTYKIRNLSKMVTLPLSPQTPNWTPTRIWTDAPHWDTITWTTTSTDAVGTTVVEAAPTTSGGTGRTVTRRLSADTSDALVDATNFTVLAVNESNRNGATCNVYSRETIARALEESRLTGMHTINVQVDPQAVSELVYSQEAIRRAMATHV